MIDKRLRSENAQRKLIIFAAEPLNFDNPMTRFIRAGSKCSLRCPRGTYKLLRGYPPSPQLVNLTSPSPNGEGFYCSIFRWLNLLYSIFWLKSMGMCPVLLRKNDPSIDGFQSTIFIEQFTIKNDLSVGMSFAMEQVLETNTASLQNLGKHKFEIFNRYSVYEHNLPDVSVF